GCATPYKRPITRCLVADATVIGREILSDHTAVVEKPPLEKTVERAWHQTRGRRSVAGRFLTGDSFKDRRRAVEIALLILRSRGPLVKVAVMADLVTRGSDS